jgi:hypothetical protein
MIGSASAVLFGYPRLASTHNAKLLVSDVGAGKEIRTPDLLITSNLGPSGVLTGAMRYASPTVLERA